MTPADRIVWDEGMLLTPQHFQQWDRHVQAELRRRSAMLTPQHWGMSRLAFDLEALRGGEVDLQAAAGVLPSGFLFEAPRPDPLPPWVSGGHPDAMELVILRGVRLDVLHLAAAP